MIAFMTALLLLQAAAAASTAAGTAPDPGRLPPPLPRPVPELPTDPPAIFLYSVDGECRVVDTRKLQGPEQITWGDVQRAKQVFREQTAWRFVDGLRRQLQERRVKLLGEMVLEGELVCHVLPSGEVVEAWIEREDGGAGRRRIPDREPVDSTDGNLQDLGTFSVELTTRARS